MPRASADFPERPDGRKTAGSQAHGVDPFSRTPNARRPAIGRNQPAKAEKRPFVLPERPLKIFLSVFSLEEERKRARARMSADDGTDIVNEDLVAGIFRADHVGQVVGVFRAVAVADEYGIALTHVLGFLHFVEERLDGFFPPHGFADGNEMPFVVDVHDGLDGEQRPDDGHCRRYPSAALEMEQIIHRKEMADVELDAFEIVIRFLQARARIGFFHGIIEIEPLAHGGTEGVGDEHLSVGIFFVQLLGGDEKAVRRTRKSARKSDDQYVASRFQKFFDVRLGVLHVHLVRRGHGAFAHPLIKIVRVDGLAVLTAVKDAVHQKAQTDAFQLMFRKVFLRHIAGRIGYDCKFSFHDFVYSREFLILFPSRSRKREHTPYFPFSQIPAKETVEYINIIHEFQTKVHKIQAAEKKFIFILFQNIESFDSVRLESYLHGILPLRALDVQRKGRFQIKIFLCHVREIPQSNGAALLAHCRLIRADDAAGAVERRLCIFLVFYPYFVFHNPRFNPMRIRPRKPL